MCSSPPGAGRGSATSSVVIGWPVAERASRSQIHAQIGGARNDLFDAHAGDVHFRQRHAQVGVAFVRADDEAAGFGDGEIDARDAGLGRQEFFAQMLAGRFGQIVGVGRPGIGAEPLVEQLADFFLPDVNRRRHDVARMLA